MNPQIVLNFNYTGETKVIATSEGGKRVFARIRPTCLQMLLAHHHRHPKDKSPGVVATINSLRNNGWTAEQIAEVSAQLPLDWWTPIKDVKAVEKQVREQKPNRRKQRRNND